MRRPEWEQVLSFASSKVEAGKEMLSHYGTSREDHIYEQGRIAAFREVINLAEKPSDVMRTENKVYY